MSGLRRFLETALPTRMRMIVLARVLLARTRKAPGLRVRAAMAWLRASALLVPALCGSPLRLSALCGSPLCASALLVSAVLVASIASAASDASSTDTPPDAGSIDASSSFLPPHLRGVVNSDPLIARWIDASESLAQVIEDASESSRQIERAEALLDTLRTACLSQLGARKLPDGTPEDRRVVRSIPDTTRSIAELLLPEIESELARCALLRNDAAALWRHLEMSRDPYTEPLSLEAMQSVLYGSEAGLLIYDGGAWNPPIGMWITATQAEGAALPARAAMMQAADAAGTRFAADPDFASRFIPARPSQDAIRRIYLAPPLGLESFPFDAMNHPVSYTPTGSMLRDRSSPRLWSGTKLVVYTSGSAEPSPAASESGARTTLPAYERARAAVRNDAILHGNATAMELRQVAEDEPIVLHLDLIAAHHPQEPDESGIVCADMEAVSSAEIAALGVAADLVSIETASDDGTPFAMGRGGLVDAFLDAGARSVVIPRWNVDDRVSERFYTELYEQLHRALPRDEAFRNAQQALLESGMDPRDVYAFAHWGSGNVPVYVLSRKDSLLPLLVGWLAFLPPVVIVVAYLRRRYLRNLAAARDL